MGRIKGRVAAVATALGCVVLTAGCGRSAGTVGSSGDVSPTGGLVATTAPGTKPVSSVVWAVYRDVNSLDPVFAFDYPENTAISLMCESLLRQSPGGAIQPGLATLATPSPTTLVFTVRPGAKFWDGHPVTAADVVYSLERNTDPKLGGYYGPVFARVKSIQATGAGQVTLTLSQPDYWLQGELASMPGIVIEKAFAVRQGKNYGTPAGGIMCTGAYRLQSFRPGAGVTAAASPGYWDSSVRPLAGQITIKGTPDVNALTSGLLTGAIGGSYTFALGTLPQLKASKAVRVFQGPSGITEAFAISSMSGVLGDVRVREALSLALDRKGIIGSVYRGAALMPRWLANPGTFGYGVAVFDRAYAGSPALNQDLARAKKLIAAAGAAGKTLTIGTTSQLAGIAASTAAYQAAAQAIGLDVTLKSVSAQQYIGFFVDPKARAGLDGFVTLNYGDYADPAALLATITLPGGSQNYDNFSDPKLTALLAQARSTAAPDARAALVARAEQQAASDLPWIPDVEPTSLLILNSGLSGAVASFSYMYAPWADSLGGTG